MIKLSQYCWCIAVLLFSVATGVSAQQLLGNNKNELPEIGVVASEALPLDKEILVGDAIMRQMRAQAPIIVDPLLDEYLQDIGNRLVANADNTKFPFNFFWVDNNAINAFAFYGGHIGVHTGLIHHAKNESELASVLAHEIAHVTQRHLARRSLAQQRSTPLQIASMIGGLLLAMADPQAGMAAMSAGSAASAQLQIDYTRSNEKEADRIGISMLARTGFDPDAAGTFFGTMAEQYRMVSRPPARLLSHPLTEDRIADARSRARDYEPRRIAENLRFHLARARVMARYTYDEKYSVEYFRAALDKQAYVFKQAAEYGLAIALMRAKEYAEAHQIIRSLLAKDPENHFYLDVSTDLDIAAQKPLDAAQRLLPLVKQTPRNPTLALNLANAWIEGGEFTDAINLLKDFLLVNTDYQLAYQLLADAYKADKQYMDMHQSKAELYALYGAYPRAVDELQYAYTFAGENHLEKQRITARIKQLREQQEKLKRL